MSDELQTTQAQPGKVEKLRGCLGSFVAAVNDDSRLRRTLKDWNPTIVIHATDTGEKFFFAARNSLLSAPSPGQGGASHQVVVQATEDVLCKVFTGVVNPVRAHLDGKLAVFATERDSVKLDAICMVLWGM